MPGFPSHVWRRRVLKLPITPAQKLVLIALAEYADYGTGRDAWPGRPRLADDCGVSESAVDRAIKAGKRHKVLVQTGRGQKGLNPAFRLVMPEDSASLVTHCPVQRVTTANFSASLVTHLPTHIPTPNEARQRVSSDALSEPSEAGPDVTSSSVSEDSSSSSLDSSSSVLERSDFEVTPRSSSLTLDDLISAGHDTSGFRCPVCGTMPCRENSRRIMAEREALAAQNPWGDAA